jgi:multidrug resistance efflux pump
MNLISKFKTIETTDLFFYAIASFFVFFIAWASFAEIDQVVRAEASVEPAKKVQKIQSRYSGSIHSVEVEVGDQVNIGDTLIKLDVRNIDILIKSATSKMDLLLEEVGAIKPLVDAGIEPKMTLIRLKQQELEVLEKIDSYKLQMANSDIQSSFNGLVTAVNVIGAGSVIREGEVLLEIVPDASYFVVKAKILVEMVSEFS